MRQTDVVGWLKTLFSGRIQVQEDIGRNALLLSGTPDNMEAALEAVRTLDQPLMAGRRSIALSPAYWSADDLAKRLNEVLSAQGYAVAPLNQLGQQGGIRYPVVLLPVSGVNQVYVFAASDEVLQHVTNWARTLDRPNERGIGKNYFTYQVKHKGMPPTWPRPWSNCSRATGSERRQCPAADECTQRKCCGPEYGRRGGPGIQHADLPG